MKGKNGGYGSRVRMRQTTAERQGALVRAATPAAFNRSAIVTLSWRRVAAPALYTCRVRESSGLCAPSNPSRRRKGLYTL